MSKEMPSQFIIIDRKNVPKGERVQAPNYEDAVYVEHEGFKGEIIFKLECPDGLTGEEKKNFQLLHMKLYHVLLDSLRLTQQQGFDYLNQYLQTLETHQSRMYQVARELDNRRPEGSPSAMPGVK